MPWPEFTSLLYMYMFLPMSLSSNCSVVDSGDLHTVMSTLDGQRLNENVVADQTRIQVTCMPSYWRIIGDTVMECKNGNWTGKRTFCSNANIDTCQKCSVYSFCFINETNTVFQCMCDSGYEGDGYNCTDIDECHRYPYKCPETKTCENYNGTFACIDKNNANTEITNFCKSLPNITTCVDKCPTIKDINSSKSDVENCANFDVGFACFVKQLTKMGVYCNQSDIKELLNVNKVGKVGNFVPSQCFDIPSDLCMSIKTIESPAFRCLHKVKRMFNDVSNQSTCRLYNDALLGMQKKIDPLSCNLHNLDTVLKIFLTGNTSYPHIGRLPVGFSVKHCYSDGTRSPEHLCTSEDIVRNLGHNYCRKYTNKAEKNTGSSKCKYLEALVKCIERESLTFVYPCTREQIESKLQTSDKFPNSDDFSECMKRTFTNSIL